jgi:hypothetical protein
VVTPENDAHELARPTPKQPAVEDGRVRNVESVLDDGEQAAGKLRAARDYRVVTAKSGGQSERWCGRLTPQSRAEPDDSVLFRGSKRFDALPFLERSDEPGDRDARSLSVEAPAVVRALEGVVWEAASF